MCAFLARFVVVLALLSFVFLLGALFFPLVFVPLSDFYTPELSDVIFGQYYPRYLNWAANLLFQINGCE